MSQYLMQKKIWELFFEDFFFFTKIILLMLGLIVDLRDLKALAGGLEMIEEENRALDQARYIYQIKPGTYIRSSQVHILDKACQMDMSFYRV